MLKIDDEGKARDFIKNLQDKLQAQIGKKFVFLLVGRTGVGKSSTVNSLMGKEIASVGDYEPTTMEVKNYDSDINSIYFFISYFILRPSCTSKFSLPCEICPTAK